MDLMQLRAAIISGLQTDVEHTARSLSGGGCEKWLAGESRIAINWAQLPILPDNAWVEVERAVTEDQRADLVVITVDDQWEQRGLLAISEFKAIENRADGYVDNLLSDLQRQLRGHRIAHDKDVLVFGVVFAVWAAENATRAGENAGLIEPLAEFVDRLKLRVEAGGMMVAGDGAFRTVFDKQVTGTEYPRFNRGLAVAMVTLDGRTRDIAC